MPWSPDQRVAWLVAGVVAATTLVVYLPTLFNGFVDFDDQTNITENPYFRGLGPSYLAWMFTHIDGLYIPLTWLSFAFDHQIWGMEPFGYHLTNLLLHVANAVLFYWLCVRLFVLARPGGRSGDIAAHGWLYAAAAVAAGLFALHPLRVESVAWVTERRDVLSGFLVLLTVRAYLAAHGGRSGGAGDSGSARGPGFATGAFALFALSLLAKSVGMSLVVVLVVLDVYPLKRLPGHPTQWMHHAYRRVWLEKLPFLGLGLVAAAVAGIAQRAGGALYSFEEYPLSGRIGQVFWALAFYLWKMVAPFELSPLYPIPIGWELLRLDVLAAAILVLGLSGVVVAGRHRWPAALAAWVCFLAFLAPLVGLAQSGPHIAADRNTYLAMLGWAAMVGGGLLALARREQAGGVAAGRARLALAVATTVLAVCAVLTWRQIGIWGDSILLWKTAVAANSSCYICQNNLGNAYLRAGRNDEAGPHFEAALRMQPGDADGRANLGNVALRADRVDDARRYFEAALTLDPDHSVSLTNLGRILIDEDRHEEAIGLLEHALRVDPVNGEGHANLGLALMGLGRLDEAEPHMREAVRILPDEGSWNNLAILELELGRVDQAAADFERAIAVAPDFQEAHYNLGLALRRLERDADAEAAFRRALAIDEGYVRAHGSLAGVLLETGRRDEGLRRAEMAVEYGGAEAIGSLIFGSMADGRHGDAVTLLRLLRRRDPADDDVASLLVWVLATAPDSAVRDGPEAVTLAEEVMARTSAPTADLLDNVAAAYAEVGRFDEAVAHAERAQALAEVEGNAEFAAEVAVRIGSYQDGTAHRAE